MCFEEASRIGIKISFIKIAGVFSRGEEQRRCNISCSNFAGLDANIIQIADCHATSCLLAVLAMFNF